MNRLTVVLLLNLAFGRAEAQLFISGRLLDKESKSAIPYGSISIANTSIGTASDEYGKFVLMISGQNLSRIIKVSCLGYNNRFLSVDSLSQNGGREIVIELTPSATILDDVEFTASAITPEELLTEAIQAVPQNYYQEPFNMEFYSNMTVRDSLNVKYGRECILLVYRKGYVKGAYNLSEVVQKRVTGKSPLAPSIDNKTKKAYFPYLPGFDIFLMDQLGVGEGLVYSVFNPKSYSKMVFTDAGISKFDEDTVRAINYRLRKAPNAKPNKSEKYSGVIYVSVNNLAILKHSLKINDHSYEIVYRKVEQKYFPYFIRTETLHMERKKQYTLTHELFLRSIEKDSVRVLQTQSSKRPEDLSFDSGYWRSNYPAPVK